MLINEYCIKNEWTQSDNTNLIYELFDPVAIGLKEKRGIHSCNRQIDKIQFT